MNDKTWKCSTCDYGLACYGLCSNMIKELKKENKVLEKENVLLTEKVQQLRDMYHVDYEDNRSNRND